MHLGRFHVVVQDLATHFKRAQLPQKLEQCATQLDQYASSKTQPDLEAFRSAVDKLLAAAELADSDLAQPYARQVIADMRISDILPPAFSETVKRLIAEKSFDPAGLATELRTLATTTTKKSAHLTAIDSSFTALEVEYERVADDAAEVGFLLPREVVGETLVDLTAEFGELSKLLRAINELVGAKDYDPRVITISSSWWQVFLDLDPNQVLVWVLAIERIINLFKSNLEIKNLQRQLGDKEMPKEITDLIEKEVERRVTTAIQELARDIRAQHAKINDQARLNEIETQLRHGLVYLARRLNQGAHVEINVGIPDEPRPPKGQAEAEEPSEEFKAKLAEAKERIAKLRDLRARAYAASSETTAIDRSAPLLLAQGGDTTAPPTPSPTPRPAGRPR